MKAKSLAWMVAGAVALVVVAFILNAGGTGDEAADLVQAQGAAATTQPPPTDLSPVAPATPSTSTTTSTRRPTTTTTEATTTTTTSTTTTTAVPVTTAASEYSSIPKLAPGQNTVAPGGAMTKHLAQDIATAFGFEVAEVEAAIADVLLPPESGGNPEGWLAPGTYRPADDASAADVVQAMVDRRVAQLEDRNIARDDWYRVLVAASVIEKETYNQNEKPKVARVLANRLAGGGPLQMDSIILYPVPEDRIFTTSEERASDQPYNSYKHNGLPPTPICSPDEASIDAFLAPPAGDWWFYVTIDLHTGETRYAVTYEEHKKNVELLRAWLRENPTD